MQKWYLFFSYASLFILGFIDNARGPLYPQILDYFQVSKIHGSLIFSLASGMSFIATLSSRWWLNKFGAINSNRIAIASHFLGCVLMGTATANSFWLFLLGSIVFGIGIGIESITLNLIIVKTSSPTNRRRILAGLHSMYGIASFIIPTIIGLLFKLNLSFQTIFLLMGALPVVLLLSTTSIHPLEIRKITRGMHSIPLIEIITVSLSFGLYVASEILISSRLVLYLEKVYLMNSTNSSLLLSLFFGLLLFGRLTFTFVHFNIHSNTLLKISTAGSLFFSLIGILFYPPALAICGLTMSFYFPCAMDFLGEHYHEAVEAVLEKVFIFVGAGLLIMHWVFGNIAEFLGLDIAIWMVPLFLVIVGYLLQFKLKFLQD